MSHLTFIRLQMVSTFKRMYLSLNKTKVFFKSFMLFDFVSNVSKLVTIEKAMNEWKCLRQHMHFYLKIWYISSKYNIETCFHYVRVFHKQKHWREYNVMYSHSQWLFYEFISNFTNNLVKQSLRVTVCLWLKIRLGLYWKVKKVRK